MVHWATAERRWQRRATPVVVLVAAAISMSGCAPTGPTPVAAAMVLQRPGQATLTHRSGPDDHCLVRSGADGHFAFFTESAETDPTAGYLLFTIADYTGPGSYTPHQIDSAHPHGSTHYTWSLGSWDDYYSSVTVTVAHVDAHLAWGSVSGTLDRPLQTTVSPIANQLRGTWSCTVGDPAPVVPPARTFVGTYTGGYVRFSVPSGWTTAAPPRPELTAEQGTLAFLASQALSASCLSTPASGPLGGTEVACGDALTTLRPDGALVTWYSGFGLSARAPTAPPGSSPFSAPTGTGWIVTDRQGCLANLGDEELRATIPAAHMLITGCLRGPDVSQLESLVRQVMESTAPAGE